jgi:hypothetical protein
LESCHPKKTPTIPTATELKICPKPQATVIVIVFVIDHFCERDNTMNGK